MIDEERKIMTLEELLKKDIFETEEVEIKQSLAKDPFSWLKSVAAFSNSKGGIFYLGVKNEDHTLIGYSKEEVDKEILFFNNEVNQHLSPKPKFSIAYLPYEAKKEMTRYIIEIDIKRSDYRPVIYKYKGVPGIYVRGEGQTNPATQEEITDMVLISARANYDELFTDEIYNETNFKLLRESYKEANGQELNEKALQAIGFLDEKGHLSNAAKLFSDKSNDPITEIRCAKWPTLKKDESLILSMEEFKGNLLNGVNFIVDYVKRNENRGELKTSNGRISVSSFPERSVLEAAVNAVAHRNYFMDGFYILVDIFPDRLEIDSPGSLLSGESLHNETDISSIRPRYRNKVISSVFKKLRLMEQEGSGFDKIVADYKNFDNKPFVNSSSSHFVITLPDLLYKLPLHKETKQTVVLFSPIVDQKDNDTKILSCCYLSYRSIKEIAESLSASASTYLRKELNRLLEQGFLLQKKRGNAILYKTNELKVGIQND